MCQVPLYLSCILFLMVEQNCCIGILYVFHICHVAILCSRLHRNILYYQHWSCKHSRIRVSCELYVLPTLQLSFPHELCRRETIICPISHTRSHPLVCNVSSVQAPLVFLEPPSSPSTPQVVALHQADCDSDPCCLVVQTLGEMSVQVSTMVNKPSSTRLEHNQSVYYLTEKLTEYLPYST